MSTQASQNDQRNSSEVPGNVELDITKLHSLPSEQQDLFLLTFVSDLVRHVQRLDANALAEYQSSIKKQLIIVLNLSSPFPGRPVRDNLGIIYSDIFSRGTRSLLYESIHELLDTINAAKGEKDLRNKHAAVVCLGHVLHTAGDSAVSLSGLVLSSLLKLLKQSQNHAGLRAAVYKALGRAVRGIGTSVDEQSARDVWKSARNAAANDKAMLAQRTACFCLESLASSTSHFDNTNDFDSLKSTIWKAIESPSASVRHAAASVLATAFVKVFTESGIPSKSRKSTKGPRKANTGLDGDDEIERPSSSASKKQPVSLSLGLHEFLRTLSGQYTKPSTSNRGRAGLAICYRYAVTRLPERIIEENFATIADHFFNDILNHPTITYHRYRLLLSRRIVRIVLDSTVSFKILNESAQVRAAQWLLNDVLKNYPQAVPERREPPKHAIVAALSSLSNLLFCLGPAANALAESCRETLLQVLHHTSYTVQVHVAHCFRALVLACPQQLLPSANSCLDKVTKNISRFHESRLHQRRCVGQATALAAVTSTSRTHPIYGSVDVFSQVLSTATELLKASSGTELRVSATQVQVAWTLIGGIMPLGPNFVKIHLTQLMLLWRNALPRPLTQDNATRRGSLETSFLAHVRECALGALLIFLEHNGPLITADGARRIAAMLQNTISFDESVSWHRQPEEIANRLIPALQLQDLMIMVRRRVLQCFVKLIGFNHLDSASILSQSNLLSLAISAFAEPQSASGQNLESLIATSASNFESLWELADNWGFGVNGLVRGFRVELLGRDSERRYLSYQKMAMDEEEGIDDTVRCSVW
jgi:HEAT repeat-containing protein 5